MMKGFLTTRAAVTLFVGSAVGVLWVGGCSDSHGSGVKLAGGCVINSDCDAPLVCAFQRCHTACETSRDCDAGQRCVASDKPFHVCQLAIESQCKANSDCPEGQVCGVDGQCRDACATTRDCVSGQVCTSATCADPDELTPQGVLESVGDAGGSASGLPCSFNSDCPSPLQCRSGTCAPECHTTADCSPGLVCDNARCVVPLACALGDAGNDPRAGAPCLYSSQCPTPLACVHGYCSCECLGAKDCAPGLECVNNRCQSVVGGANSVEIGANGGTITSSDGVLSMTIPAGAVDSSIVFAVRPATAWPSGAVGQVYEVEPSGTHFAKPATIALSYAGVDLGQASSKSLFVGTAVGSAWQSLGTAVDDPSSKTVASTTTHLSVFGLVLFAAPATASADAGVINQVGRTITGLDAGKIGSAGSGNIISLGGSTNGGAGADGIGGGTGTGIPEAGGFVGIGGVTGGGGGTAIGGRAGIGGLPFGGGPSAGGFTSSGAVTGAGGFSSGGGAAGSAGVAKDAGSGPVCTGGCACLHTSECPAVAPLACCYDPKLLSSACQDPTTCVDNGGSILQ